MARACKWIGVLALLLGFAIAAASALQIQRDEAYRKAELVARRNPGNVLYEAEFKGAQVRRGFQIFGTFGGGLLALNGLTLLLLGAVAGRAPKIEARSSAPGAPQG